MFTKRLFQLRLHSRRVLIFKRSLPVFAFLLASLILIWPSLFSEREQFAPIIKKDAVAQASIDMTQVRFFSQNSKNQPMTVVAESVRETNADDKVITLVEPVATYIMSDGTQLTSMTSYGLAFQNDEYLYFEDQVKTTTDTGYTSLSRHVTCDYQAGTIESNSEVFIDGPAGQLIAQGFLIYNKGENVDFKGVSKGTFFADDGDTYLEAHNGLLIDRKKRIVTALGNVYIRKNNQTLKGDKVLLYYTDDRQNRFSKMEAFGNVSAFAEGNTISGERGIYTPKSGRIDVYENVQLKQGAQEAQGSHAYLNLNTGVGALTGPAEPSGRVRGSLLPSELGKEK